MSNAASWRRRLFGISPEETRYERRGFAPPQPAVQKHLERAGGSFVAGYNEALADPRAGELAARLDEIEDIYRGFAFEGAAMGLALLDFVTPWNRGRFAAFCEGPAEHHVYMLYVGAGWAIARLPWARRNFERAMGRYDPLFRWLTLDGYGFHQGYFYATDYVEHRQVPPRLSEPARRVFDQGLGRSMWFSQGGDPQRIAAAIAPFDRRRQEDLWSGIGLGGSYAGGVARETLEALRTAAGAYRAHVAQGAAFAAKARERAGTPSPYTDLACEVFCQLETAEAAAVTDDCLQDLPPDGPQPAYELWRQRIREQLASLPEAVARR